MGRGPDDADVQVFATCLVDQVRPSIGRAVLDVLARAGVNASLLKGATCCGQPAWNGGLVDDARRVARRTLKAFKRTRGTVVVPSGSCATMIHEFWPELFRGTPDEDASRDTSSRVREFSSFLAERTPETESAGGQTVAYHDACHMLRELHIRDEPRQVLRNAGYEIAEMPGARLCCGFGGTFSVKLPEVSVAMADEKLDEVVATGSKTLIGCDFSCLMHLGGRAERRGLDLKCVHLAELLADG